MNIADTIGVVLKSKGENNVVTIAPEQSVEAALRKLAEYEIGSLAVVSNQRLVGIFSERDYARKSLRMGHLPSQTQVGQVMTSPAVCITPEYTVDECMTLMTEQRIRHFPVLRDGALVGVVSIGDLVKWVISGQAQTIQELAGYITGSYPA
jgi:CBS domain-containing protein